MGMHNIRDNPDVMKEIAKTMKKAEKAAGSVECLFGEIKITFNKIIISGKANFYITPKKQQAFLPKVRLGLCSDVHLRKTNSPYAAYKLDELIEIVKSGDFSFC